jgi:hypothetical protein
VNADPKLRKWLNHKPRPVVVECDEHRIDAPNTDRGWAEVAETIEQLKPERIVCRDAQGKVLRAKPFEYFFPQEEPVLAPVPAPASPEQATLQHFAVLLSNAHSSAASTHAPIMAAAMDLVERLSARLTRTEAELDAARRMIADLESELAEANARPESDGIMGAISAGAAAAAGNVAKLPQKGNAS